MNNFSDNPLKANNFDRTFTRWGTFDRRRKASNLWHNPEIPPPAGFDYKALTADLHPDQEAYRRWLLDILAFLLFQMALNKPVIRFLELGCADAREIHLSLEKFASLWKQGNTCLEIHLLDDDKTRLSEAANEFNGYAGELIRLVLWFGKIEELEAGNFKCISRYPGGSGATTQSFPETFNLIFSQLVLHHYPLFQLVDIFKSIYDRLIGNGCFVLSDIFYTGIALYDALTWNRVLFQIENLPEGPRRLFWLNHYQADYPTYQTRKDILAALELIGFNDVEMLQCAYDLATVVGVKNQACEAGSDQAGAI